MTSDSIWLRHLQLAEFRVYRHLDLNLNKSGLRIVGPNGTGKTSIIDAILLLSTTRSRKGVLDSDLINHLSGVDIASRPFTRVSGEVVSPSNSGQIEIYIERTDGNSTRKLLRIGDAPRKAADVVGLLTTVSFSPEDLEIVIGSPSIRRRFLDVLLSQSDPEYLRNLARYSRMLGHRNSLLKSIQAGQGRSNELEFWDDQIVALGSYVMAARAIAIRQLSKFATDMFHEISSFGVQLGICYGSSLDRPTGWWDSISTQANEVRSVSQRVAVVFESVLREVEKEDIARGVTTVGPHRDDLEILLGDKPMSRFGSRGQQRLAIVALKLAEIEYLTTMVGARPVLLLDDVLSELDEIHREELIKRVSTNNCQMFVTATERQLAEHPSIQNLDLMTLQAPGIPD